MSAFYHVCFIVPDLESAMADLNAAVGCQWHHPWSDRLGESKFRMTFSRGPAPYIELVTGGPGGPWDATSGARFDHLGYWTSSVDAAAQRLTEHGFTQAFSGCPSGRPFVGHRVNSIGASIELFDIAAQPYFLDKIDPDGPAMAPLTEPPNPT